VILNIGKESNIFGWAKDIKNILETVFACVLSQLDKNSFSIK
jgi:hypothetical protein